MALSALLRTLEIPTVPHGFRSTFREWAAEETNHPCEVVEAAHARSDLFERQRRLKKDWPMYLASTRRSRP